jgi:tRNA-splicing ligase RtcB
MIRIDTEKLPIFIWADETDLPGFESAIEQAKNLANHPLARQHVALMPDFHIGYGMPIGGVLATIGGVIPNAVGVDIGCGMIAAKTDIEADSLTREDLEKIRKAIHARVPVGFAGHSTNQVLTLQATGLPAPIQLQTALRQVGTLGGGNHFIEVQRDAEGYVWLMVHSGSRNLGKQVCDYFDDVAKGGHPAIKDGRVVVDRTAPKPLARADELAFLAEGSAAYEEYITAMHWCMAFAEESRVRMLDGAYSALMETLGEGWHIDAAIQTHHNYASPEEHFGEKVLVHRKGAVKAEGPVIIPGSMGTASYIAEGKAESLSFMTCSHGAGRVLGRKEANRTISHEEAVRAMEHVVFGVRNGDYEEMPQAYKDIHKVMANQADLVEPTHLLKPLAVVKG